MFQLPWLHVRFRSQCNIRFLTFKVLNGTALVYLSDLVEKYIPVRMIRFLSYSLLRVPRSHRSMYGQRSFRTSAPRPWNELPKHIKHVPSKHIFNNILYCWPTMTSCQILSLMLTSERSDILQIVFVFLNFITGISPYFISIFGFLLPYILL